MLMVVFQQFSSNRVSIIYMMRMCIPQHSIRRNLRLMDFVYSLNSRYSVCAFGVVIYDQICKSEYYKGHHVFMYQQDRKQLHPRHGGGDWHHYIPHLFRITLTMLNDICNHLKCMSLLNNEKTSREHQGGAAYQNFIMIRRHVLKFQYDRLTVDISYTVGHVYISLCSSITIRHLMLSNIYCTFGFEYCINVLAITNLIITAIRYDCDMALEIKQKRVHILYISVQLLFFPFILRMDSM